jgi:hypothetical protein
MAGPDLLQDTEAIQRFGHMRLHADEEKMLSMPLHHTQHIFNS